MLKLDINLLWTVVNVLVMYAVLRKFLFKPVQDVIAKRQRWWTQTWPMRRPPRRKPQRP